MMSNIHIQLPQIKPRNLVAKNNKNKSVVMRDRTQYNRKQKHKKDDYNQ
jgi:hypothetical protein